MQLEVESGNKIGCGYTSEDLPQSIAINKNVPLKDHYEKLLEKTLNTVTKKPPTKIRIHVLKNLENNIKESTLSIERQNKHLQRIIDYLGPKTQNLILPEIQSDEPPAYSRDIEIDPSSKKDVSQATEESQSSVNIAESPDQQDAEDSASEDDEDDNLFEDIPVDTRSLPAVPTEDRQDSRTEHFSDGPVISNHADMIALINDFDEYEFIISSIRRSTIEYTPQMRDRIESIEAEYALVREGTEEPRYLETSIQAFVSTLEDHLQNERRRERNSVVHNIHKLRFYQSQKRIYSRVYSALAGSALPYSKNQGELLGLIRGYMESATGCPTNIIDARMIEDIHALLFLLGRDDFDSTDTRLVIYSTLDHHAKLIVKELRSSVTEEEWRGNPFSHLDAKRVNLATFVTESVKEIFNINREEEMQYKDGYREILNKSVAVLVESGFPFNTGQLRLVRNLCSAAINFNGDISSERYEVLKIQFLALIEYIRNEHPEREVITTHTAKLVDINGPVSKAVDRILDGLKDLSKTSTAHFMSFGKTELETPDLLPLVVRHLLRVYPPRYIFPQPRAHNGNTSQRDMSTST